MEAETVLGIGEKVEWKVANAPRILGIEYEWPVMKPEVVSGVLLLQHTNLVSAIIFILSHT